jgi:hypothetical protein
MKILLPQSMRIGYVDSEHTTVEVLGSTIVAFLLEEKRVIIPELGYLELKVFPDKRTVLFKATENETLFSGPDDPVGTLIYNNVSVPLKEGQVVTVPEVGIFRPMKNADGSYRVSYTISSALRKLLNGGAKEEEAKKTEIPSAQAGDEKTAAPVAEAIQAPDCEESAKGSAEDEDAGKRKEKTVAPLSRQAAGTNAKGYPDVRNTSGKSGVALQGEKKNTGIVKTSGIIISGIIVAIIAAVIALFYMAGYLLPDDRNDNRVEPVAAVKPGGADKSAESIDLPSLAEQKYGNRMFWVYIYDANRDIISSPVNIPAGTVLMIPDLWEDYKVDVMDSMEIKKAGILSDIMLKQKTNSKNKKRRTTLNIKKE